MMYTKYFWVVICKNYRFHRRGNTSYAHQIALGETDAFATLPVLAADLRVRCDKCGEEYCYAASEVMRNEIAGPEAFSPHPMFD